MLLLYSKWRSFDPFLMIHDFPFLCREVLSSRPLANFLEKKKKKQNIKASLTSVTGLSQAMCGQVVQRPDKKHEVPHAHLPFFFF